MLNLVDVFFGLVLFLLLGHLFGRSAMEYMRGPVVRCQLQNAESFMARVGRGLSGPERLSPSGGAFNKTYFNATTNGCTATIYIYIYRLRKNRTTRC